MGIVVFGAIVVASVLAGVAVQVRGANASRYDAAIVSVTAIFGAYFASETFPGSAVFGTITTFGPVVDGFVVIPGVVFAALVATVAYAGTRDLYPSSAVA